ncbi:MAG TPA: EAL domain-containing protein [Polyangiaceae bacterium]|nr:EAL domain-containing protein [Polyangiaceae bacterium]
MSPPTIGEIRAALDANAFVFFYQPKISFLTGRITGGEALIRWRTAEGRIVPPGVFIPIAEAEGFISEITRRMFPRLLEDYRVISAETEGHVAFNVSASDLQHEGLVLAIEEALDGQLIPADRLRLEVTEAAALSTSSAMREWVGRLVKRGVEFAMDDFGTGYSSLDAIRQLPFATLKVDQGMVREMQSSERAAMLVHANVSLAQVLGMEAVAEGIETEPIYRALMHSGCREGQGYWMSRPLPLPDYLALVKSGRTWPASHAGLLRSVLMNHIVELRRVLDWVYSARTAQAPDDIQALQPLGDRGRIAFSGWYEGPGRALHGNRAYESMRVPNAILNETYDTIQAKAKAGADPQELAPQLKKLSHYAVVLIGDLLRLESELLLEEMRRES